MTKYYFVETNADNDVIATDGTSCYLLPANSKGIDETTGVDLYADNAVEELKKALKAMADEMTLYNIDDIKRDFPDSICDFNADDYEAMTELIAID